MATGINTEKINSLKVDLLNYTESINTLATRLDNCRSDIQANLEGVGKSEFLGKLDSIIEELPKVNKNINSYIASLGKVVKSYEDQDQKLASDIKRNISKLDEI